MSDIHPVSEVYHVQSIREILTLKIDGVASNMNGLREVLNERDRLYGQRFEAMDKANTIALSGVKDATAAALNAAKEAVNKAEMANEKRFESVNEFRGQLKDMISSLVTKEEVAARFIALEDKLGLLQEHDNVSRGRSVGANWLWSVIAAAAGLLFGIVSTGLAVYAFMKP